MIELKKTNLDFEKTIIFIKNNLENTNALSNALLDNINFRDGFFFTFLPENIGLERIYEFKFGGILPQYSVTNNVILNKERKVQIIPNTINQICEYIMKFIYKNKTTFCVVDDITRYPNEIAGDLAIDLLYFYNKESYYFLMNSFDLLSKSLKQSKAFWHSLCIIAEKLPEKINRSLSLDVINKISLNTKVIIIGAYDGEGYIIWEKRND